MNSEQNIRQSCTAIIIRRQMVRHQLSHKTKGEKLGEKSFKEARPFPPAGLYIDGSGIIYGDIHNGNNYSFAESNLPLKEKTNHGEGLSTSLNKVRFFDTGYKIKSCDDDGDTLKSMNNDDSDISEPEDNHKQNNLKAQLKPISESQTKNKPKNVQHELTQDLLSGLRLCPLNGQKWLWNGPLPSSMITHIQAQMESDDVNTISFDDGKNFGINKFLIDIDEEVMKFLNAFRDYKSWDIRISSGEVSSVAYYKLKELAQIQVNSGPKMDSRAIITSISQEVLIQENERYDTANKRKNNLPKPEYCSKLVKGVAQCAVQLESSLSNRKRKVNEVEEDQMNGRIFG
ncbi:17104_t:CDS:10 [Funneliformis caledonium]|uniref:17104_t:CDS:1 n=1 Tax=Funneliformis caledonium TaxID=1117310 RepID=A0A9N9AMK0_9GLOM|nr:17104_t:CDS:10 [Funneliformis caledonium]